MNDKIKLKIESLKKDKSTFKQYISSFCNISKSQELFKNNKEFKAKYVGTDKKEVKRITSDDDITKIFESCKGTPFIVKSITHKDRPDNPTPPFCTATFQQECSRKLGISVE